MKKLLIGFVFLLTVAVINVPDSDGYPWIFTRWRAKYLQPVEAGQDDPFKQQVMEAGCYVCHDPAHTEDEEGWEDFHNEYGQHIVEILGDPHELEERFKDRSQRDAVNAEIDAAIEQVGGMDSPTGETYDEIIAAGALPYAMPEGFGEDN